MSQPSALQPKIILCVPGSSRDRSDLLRSIVEKSGGFVFAANVILNTQTREAVKCEVRDHDPRLAKAFSFAGRHWTTKEDLDRIDAHTTVLYLIGPGGSQERARAMMDFGAGLLKAGGLAIKVETAGAGHSPAHWGKMGEKKTIADLFRAFVIVATGAETTYSCGMHNLGCRDAVITSALSQDAAYRLVTQLLLYVLREQAVLKDGETFSLAVDAPHYRLREEACLKFAPDNPFHNHYGMWRLVPIAGRPAAKEA